jgi:hypothetical protein
MIWTLHVYTLRKSHTQHYTMRADGLSGDAVAAIVLGILQRGIGLVPYGSNASLDGHVVRTIHISKRIC